MNISISFDPESCPELTELYEEANRILKANGRPAWDFELFCTACLTMGAIPHMIRTARALVGSTKKKQNIETE